MTVQTDNPKTDPIDFAPGILRVQHQPPLVSSRKLMYVVVALFTVIVIWAIFGRLDVIAVAQGKLVPQSYLKIVQPSESGIVKELLAKEGAEVVAGQVLMRMDTKLSEADTKTLLSELSQRELQLRRIDAELSDLPLKRKTQDQPALFHQIEAQYAAHRKAYLDVLEQEKAVLTKAQEDMAAAQEISNKLKQTLPVYQAQEKAFDTLAKEGYAGKLQAMDRQRERIEKEQDLRAQNYNISSLQANIAQSEKRLAQIKSLYQQQLQNERVETQAQYQRLQQEWAKQHHRNTLLELRAPSDGIVKDVATHTSGTVVSPGTVLMTLIPKNESLHAEVWVDNEDVGFVHADQKVKLKLAAYPFQKYGMIDGVVKLVSADASEAPSSNDAKNKANSSLSYRALIALNAQHLKSTERQHKITPGMQVTAEIKLGERSVIEYLLSPVQKAFYEAARER